MKKLRALFSDASTIIVCSLFSLVVTWASGNPIFSLLSMGKGFSGRSLSIQILFLSVLFLFYLTICLIVFRKQAQWLVKNPLFAFTILSLIPLVAYAYMGSFSRFVADDFSSATLAVHKGILQATVDWYVNWSGRFTASFFDSVMGYLPPSAMMWETGLAILFLMAGMTWAAWHLIPIASKWSRLAFSMILSSMIITVSFFIAPDIPQSLYWGQGMRSLILPLIPASVLAALMIQITRRPSPNPSVSTLVLIGTISLFAGGFGETYVVLQITAFSLFAIATFLLSEKEYRQRIMPVIFSGLFFSLLAMLIIVLAPGNKVRQSYFPPSPDIISLLAISARSLWIFLSEIFRSTQNDISLIIIFLINFLYKCLCERSYKRKTQSKLVSYPSFRFPLFRLVMFLAISVILLFASFVPAAYGMSTTPPDRTLILPAFILTLSIAMGGSLAGSVVSRRHGSNWFTTRFSGWVLFTLFSLFIFNTTSIILSSVDDYCFFASRFDRADNLIREARAQGLSSVEVPEVHNHFGLSDYGAGTTYWLDEAVNSYYGIDVIVNKHMK